LLTDTGRWATPARLALAFSKAGAEVSVLCLSRHPVLKARGISKTFHFASLHPLESLQTAIQAFQPSIVVPCDDRSVEFLHQLHAGAKREPKQDTADLISRSLGGVEGFPVASSRYELLKLAREEGIKVPETRPIHEPGDLHFLKEAGKFPWVMKIDGTSGGQGVRFVQTPADAAGFFFETQRFYRATRILKRLIVNRDPFLLRPWWRGIKPKVIAQAYISGRPANCAVACWQGRILAGSCVEVVSATGATGQATVVRVVNNPEMLLAAERIARRLQLSGFFGLDFVLEEGTETPYLIEMNPRSTPLTHLQLGKGRDLIGALVAELSGAPPREAPPVTRNDMIAYFPQAWISNSEFLQSAFQDIPWEEPELTKELLRPWPNRSSIYVVYQFLWTRLFAPNSAEQ
jgi:hypothetical protein